MSEWQPIRTAPKDGTEILVFGFLKVALDEASIRYMEVCRFYKDRWTVEWMDSYKPPTHWQHLPEPPR